MNHPKDAELSKMCHEFIKNNSFLFNTKDCTEVEVGTAIFVFCKDLIDKCYEDEYKY